MKLERDIEKAACRRAKKLGFWERKFKSPGRRSAPDRIFAMNGCVFWIEFKALGEKPTPLQAKEHKRMRAVGLTVYVCDRADEYEAVFEYEKERADQSRL